MKLTEKHTRRLHTKNFRLVISEAVTSIDYDSKQKIIEIEFKSGDVYHYLHINKNIWDTFLKFADKGKGLGAYVNQDFKKMIEDKGYDYYELK